MARAEKENEPLAAGDEKCCLCLRKKATVRASPCQHRFSCKLCAIKMIQVAHESNQLTVNCPLCRADIARFEADRVPPKIQEPPTRIVDVRNIYFKK